MAIERRQISSNSVADQSAKVPWMMLCVTTSYIVLLLPVSIYSLLVENLFNITYAALSVLNTVNCAINFYFYFLSGNLFRAEVKKALRCCCKSRDVLTIPFQNKNRASESGIGTITISSS